MYYVFRMIGEEWEQESIGFETYNEAKNFYDCEYNEKNCGRCSGLRIFKNVTPSIEEVKKILEVL